MKKTIFLAVLIGAFSVASFAQTREPSKPARPFVVKTGRSVAELERSLRGENKTLDLTGGAGTQLRVAVQHDEKRDESPAEVHDESDDVYYVLEGSAELTLGGELENPSEESPGEWRGEKIKGGETFTIGKGDLVVVPRGTPHRRVNAKGKTFSLILIKVFARPVQPAR